MTIVFGLNLLIPLMAIAFNNRLSAWVIFILGTFHGLEHAMAGTICTLILALITLAVPGVYRALRAKVRSHKGLVRM